MFGVEVDFATVHKEYESVAVGPGRYAPPRVKGVVKRVYKGRPDAAKICTSIVERNNLTIRTMQRRFTCLALGFSRKIGQPWPYRWPTGTSAGFLVRYASLRRWQQVSPPVCGKWRIYWESNVYALLTSVVG